MGYVRRALGGQEARSSRRHLPHLGGRSTGSGVSVSPERALQIGAVYSCVRLLSEAVAGLPVGMFRRKGDTRIPIGSHPVLSLISDYPNPDIDAGELWRTVMGWMLLRGNSHVYIQRNGGGSPIGLWPIAPTSVENRRDSNGRLVYKVTLQTDVEYAPITEKDGLVRAENMLHFRAFGLGVQGLSPISLAREQVGISFAAQQYIGGFFARDASPGGILEAEGELSDKVYDRLEAQYKDLHEGFDNAHRIALLEAGVKWKDVTLSPDDAQFIETQKFSRGEIASIFGVPPHMIGDTERSTSWGTGIAEQGIGFVTYSLLPWLQRLERVTRRRLLGASDADMRMRWNVAGLMKGDLKSRYDAYAVGKQWGWLSTNDILRMEDEAPVKGGDVYLQPLNMVPAGMTPVQRGTRTVRTADPGGAPAAWVTRNRELLASAFEEQRADVIADGGRLDREKWDALLADILHAPAVELSSEVAALTASSLGGSYDPTLAAAFVRALAEAHARNLNITTEGQLADALSEQDDVATAADTVFDEADNNRVGPAAVAFVAATANFARHEGASQSGAKSKRWIVTSTNPRPSHSRMHGEEVPMQDAFSNGARWPRDAAAGADETAGCTCEIEFNV